MTQTIYKVGEAAGQVLSGLCPGASAEQGGKDGAGSRDANSTRADTRVHCNERVALLRHQLSRFFTGRALNQVEEHSTGKEPGSEAVMTTPTVLNFHVLDQNRRMAAANRAVNRAPYGRIDGTAHVTWRARDSSIILSDEVRAARAEGSCYLLCLQDLVREAESPASFHIRRKTHPEL